MVLFLVVCVNGMDVNYVRGTSSNGDVSHDFGKTFLRVSPETAISSDNDYSQNIIITNTYGVDLYYYIDGFFSPKDISNAQIFSTSYTTAQEVKYVRTCSSVYNSSSSKNEEVCSYVENGFNTVVRPVYSSLTKTTKDWGEQKHYLSTTGFLVKAGETKDFQIRYKTNNDYGKWNARVWADTKDDYTCIEKENCVFDFVIDPFYSQSIGNSHYYYFDRNVSDEIGGYQGTLNGAVFSRNSKLGNGSVWFDGVSDAVTLSSDDNLCSQLTFCAWLKYNSSMPDVNGFPISLHNPSGAQDMGVFGAATIAQIQCRFVTSGGEKNDYTSASNLSASGSNYSHVCCVHDDANNYIRTYVNGSQTSATATGAVSQSTTNCDGGQFGGYYSSVNNDYGGYIDEISFWNRTLNSSEISEIYTNLLRYNWNYTGADENFTVTIQNVSYGSPVYETSNQSYFVNISFAQNVTGVDTFVLNIFSTNYSASLYDNGTCGENCTWNRFNVSNIRVPLTTINGTNYPLNFTYVARYSNGTNITNSTSNYSQYVNFAYLPLNIFIETPIIETWNTTWNVTYSNLGNITDVTFLYVTQWNVTNTTGVLYENNSAQRNVSFSYNAEMLNSTDNNKLITMIPYLNITFNGTTLTRNGSAGGAILSANQLVYKMVLTNCSGGTSISNTTTNQFYIRDSILLTLINANSLFEYNIWLPSNNISLSRNYNFSFTSNSSPNICVYPTFASYNSTFNLIASLTGYVTNTLSATSILSNTSVNYTIYLTNSSSIIPITYYVVDSSENPLNNYTIETYVYLPANASEYLISTDATDSTGSVVVLLPENTYFKWKVYNTASSLVLSLGPTYLASTTTSKTFVIGENASTGLDIWINIYGLNCSVTWNNATNITNFTWSTSIVNITQICFNLFNISGGDFVLFSQNCSTNLSGSLSLNANYPETSWLSYPVTTLANESTTYILYCSGESPLSFNTITTSVNYGTEGVFWAMILLILVATMGLMGEGASYISMMLIIAWVPAVSLWNLIPWTYSTIIGIISFLIIWIMGLRRERG